MADINLSLATRTTLLQLQRARALIDATAQRLSTGVRVNAITDATAFFDARSLTDRAGDLLGIKDNISEAASTVGGAARLINADVNEVAANLLALQTRHDLALGAMSLSFDNGSAIFTPLQLG